MNLTKSQMVALGLTAAGCFVAWKFGGQFGKMFAGAVGSIAIARQLPYFKDAVA